MLSKAAAGLAAGAGSQRVPVHARASSTVAPPAVYAPPTAVQARVLAQETPFSQPPDAVPGTGCLLQRLPSQRAANGALVCAVTAPTAVQARGAAHETPLNPVPTGLAKACGRQRAPFQTSASARWLPLSSAW